MLAQAAFALSLILAQVASASCRAATAPGRCWQISELEGRTFALPSTATRFDPDALRLCPPPALPDKPVDFAVVVPTVNTMMVGDSAVRAALSTFQELSQRLPGVRTSLSIPGPTRPDLGPFLPAPGDSSVLDSLPIAHLATGTSLVTAFATTVQRLRNTLYGNRAGTVPVKESPHLVIFVLGPARDWSRELEIALAAPQVALPGGGMATIAEFGRNIHVIQLVRAPDADGLSELRLDSLQFGIIPHQLVEFSPSVARIDSILRTVVAPIGRPASLLRDWELTNTTLGVRSRMLGDPGSPDTTAIVLDSALPLAEGTNRLQAVRRYSAGARSFLDTAEFLIDVGGTSEEEPGPDDSVVSWTCPPTATLRIARAPTRELPRTDLEMTLPIRNVPVLLVELRDSATGKVEIVPMERGVGDAWSGSAFSPFDSASAPFEVSSRGDFLVARWHHPRDPRDSLRDTLRLPSGEEGWIQVSRPALPWPGGLLEVRAWLPNASGDTIPAEVRCGAGSDARTVPLLRDGDRWVGSFRIWGGTRPWGDSSLRCPDPGEDGILPSVSIVLTESVHREIPLVDRPVGNGEVQCALRPRPGACIDVARIPAGGWSIPSNTTHADLRTLPVCIPEMTIPAPARVVWVIDNSGSMAQNDRNNQRFLTMQRGLILQARRNPASKAAIQRFSSFATSMLPMTTLDDVGLPLAIQVARPMTWEGQTDWESALRMAMDQFGQENDPSPPAIIFLTDGLPNIGDWRRALVPGMPPVYPIYIGGTTPLTPDLFDLARLTGGRAWLLGANPSAAALDDVVATIMGTFVTTRKLFRASLQNLTTIQGATYREFNDPPVGSPILARSNAVLALAEGDNAMRFSWMSEDDPLQMHPVDWNFSLTLPPSPTSRELEGTPFVVTCGDPGGMRFLDSTGKAVDWLPTRDAKYGIEIEPRSPVDYPDPATATSSRRAGSDTIQLPERSFPASGAPRNLGTGILASDPGPGLLAIDTLGDTLVATWCDSRVPRDCASGRLALVRVPVAPTIRFLDDAPRGPSGTLRVEIVADPLAPESLAVLLESDGGRSHEAQAVRGPDGIHRVQVAFRQVSGTVGEDTLALGPPPGGTGTVAVRVRTTTGPDTARDTVAIGRRIDSLAIEPGEIPGTLLVHLATPDGSGEGRTVVLSGPAGTDSVLLGPDGRAVATLRRLVGDATDTSRIAAFAVDPLYGDTLRALGWAPPLPSSAIRILGPVDPGPVGEVHLEAEAPTDADSLVVEVRSATDSVRLVLRRVPDGTFRGTLPFSMLPARAGDSLRLPPLRASTISAHVPPGPSWKPSVDSARVETPPASWTAQAGDSGRIRVVSPRTAGLATTVLLDAVAGIVRIPVETTNDGDIARIEAWDLVGESLDSVELVVLRVDPLFGDTTRRSVRVASPWTPSQLEATPDSLDPRRGDSTLLRVVDRDVRPDRIDTALVRGPDERTWVLVETAPASGRFEARIASRDLARDWASHPYREPWSVEVLHVDPDHPADTSRALVHLLKEPLPPESTSVDLASGDPEAVAGRFTLVVRSPRGTDSLRVALSWQGGTDTLTLGRGADGLFRTERTWARWPGDGRDTIRLPGSRDLVVVARVVPDSTRRESRDSLALGSRKEEFEVRPRDALSRLLVVPGATGPASSFVVLYPGGDATLRGTRGPDGDTAVLDLDRILPESLDSVSIEILRIDPVYGDTSRRVLRVASPWQIATIATDPDTLDVLSGSNIAITVVDRDPDPDRIDEVMVRTSSGTEFVLKETSRNSGTFLREVPSWRLDTGWVERPGDARWPVEIVYVDPRHPGDTARTTVVLFRPDIAPSMRVVHPVRNVAEAIHDGPALSAAGLNLLSADLSPEQGLEIQSWIPVALDVFVYDRIGVWIARGEFRLDPDPVRFTNRFLLTWNGRDQAGVPVSAGIYLLRVVVRDSKGRLLSNRVFQLGRREPTRDGGS